jgi:hypothetical protein
LTNNVLASLRERGERNPTINNSIQESESNAPIEFNDGINNVYNKFAAKSLYIKKYLEKKRLSTQRASYDETYWQNYVTEFKTIYGENFLDIVVIRILIIFPFLASFLSLLLLGLYFDGYPINIWICAFPVLFFFVYVLLCVALLKYVKNNQFTPKSYFSGLWANLRTPLKTLFSETPVRDRETGGFHNNNRRCCCFTTQWGSNHCCYGSCTNPRIILSVILFFLLLIQIILITLKLSAQSSSSGTTPSMYNTTWGVTLIPLWCIFALYCFSSNIIKQDTVFMNILIFLWTPFFILSICLTVKLDGINNIPLAYIFIPFWLMEAVILIFSLIFLIVGYKR